MKFTVASHAGLYVENNDRSLLIDPWLIGSCYWRSWWNFPEPDRKFINNLKPNFIYISHHHWDHFHGPSLRLFDPAIKIYLPLINSDFMVRDLRKIGFKNVEEIPHGTGVKLGPDFHLFSFQAGIEVDSSVVITNGATTLLDVNDCKLFGLPLRQITDRFKKFDFVFRSHSNASCIPYCIEDHTQMFGLVRSSQEYIEEFTNFALHVEASYAIPFASNHCFLHRETFRFNDTVVDPIMVQEYYNKKADGLKLKTRCIVMPPESSWSEEKGFSIKDFDYGNKKQHLDFLSAKYSKILSEQYTKEASTLTDHKAFKTYFGTFFRSLPFFLFLYHVKVLFKILDRTGYKYWIIDFNKRRVNEVNSPIDSTFIIESSAFVINDCVRKKMFSVWHPSKRLKITMSASGKLFDVVSFFCLLEFFETGILPIRKNFTSRSLSVRLRRWRDIVELTKIVFNYLIIRKPLKRSDFFPINENRLHSHN